MIKWIYRSLVKPVVRAVTPRVVWKWYWGARWYHAVGLPADICFARAVGWTVTLRLRTASLFPGRVRPIRLAALPYSIFYRTGSSDPDVIRQVFGAEEYRCVAAEPAVEFILDCGANIGLTSLYLLHRYPAARAIVVEPDSGNMSVCRKNLAPFAGRVIFVQSGVWSAPVPLVVERGGYLDGRDWATQVRPVKPGESPDLTAQTVSDLMAAGGFPRIDILKVDIESAEAEVFAGPTEWLDRVRTLVIELHGPTCERVVAESVAGRLEFAETRGELTVYRTPANRREAI